jgi:hypothetical protein
MSEEREKLVDEILDQALANYSQAEPRMGLEGRVLARLEEEKTAGARAWWWKWAWAPVAAALLIAGGLYLARPKTGTPSTVAVRPTPPVTIPAPATQPPVAQVAAQVKPRVGRTPQPRPALAFAAAKQPQFPAPQALGEQERLLLAYVRLQPQAAAQQAKAAGEPLADIKIQPLDIPPVNPDGNQQAPER